MLVGYRDLLEFVNLEPWAVKEVSQSLQKYSYKNLALDFLKPLLFASLRLEKQNQETPTDFIFSTYVIGWISVWLRIPTLAKVNALPEVLLPHSIILGAWHQVLGHFSWEILLGINSTCKVNPTVSVVACHSWLSKNHFQIWYSRDSFEYPTGLSNNTLLERANSY